MYKFLLFGIIAVAFLLRVVALSSYPVGFTPDEASFGYDAYSLLKTGKDQWGKPWPITFRSFGDFKLPLYTYLTIPSVAVVGLNEFSVRLPSAVFGTLAILITYLLAKSLFKDQKIAIFSSLLLAISPWHISLSRGAFEANLTTFLMPLGVWAFLRGLERPRWMILSAFAFGLNLFTYHSARFLTPLLVMGLIYLFRHNFTLLQNSVRRYGVACAIFLIFLLVAGYTMFLGAGSRSTDVAIFNPTDKWAAVADRRYEAVREGMPDEISRIFSNKFTYVFDQFISGYFSYLSPQFFFAQGAGEWTYGMIPGRGVLYLIEVPFLLTALWMIIRGRTPGLGIILVWILLAPIPVALSKGPGFAANRAAVMMPALQILSAYGAVVLYEILVKKWPRIILLSCYLAILFSFLLVFLEDYMLHAPVHGASSMLYGRREAVEYTKTVETKYKEIFFSRSLSEPHIYVAFFSQWNPQDYQIQSQDWLRYEQEKRSFVDQLGEYHLGKYTFHSINYQEDKNLSDVLLVGKPEEFPQNTTPLKSILSPLGRPAIFVVESSGQDHAKSN